jgi:hypothetical protein
MPFSSSQSMMCRSALKFQILRFGRILRIGRLAEL